METVQVYPSFPGTTCGSEGPSRPSQKKPYLCCTDSLWVPYEVPETLIQISLDGKWALNRGLLFLASGTQGFVLSPPLYIPWRCGTRRYLQGNKPWGNEVKGIIETSQISGYEAGCKLTFCRHWEKGGEKRTAQSDVRANTSRYVTPDI